MDVQAQTPTEVLNMAGKGRATVDTMCGTKTVEPIAHTALSVSGPPGDEVVAGEVQQLLMLQELIRRRLEGHGATT